MRTYVRGFNLKVWLEGTEVGLVDVVDDDGGDRNDLGRPGGHYCHQDQEQGCVLP